eukprot:scaffold66087_cov31-Tisochrysis_lutea.AAC.2
MRLHERDCRCKALAAVDNKVGHRESQCAGMQHDDSTGAPHCFQIGADILKRSLVSKGYLDLGLTERGGRVPPRRRPVEG